MRSDYDYTSESEFNQGSEDECDYEPVDGKGAKRRPSNSARNTASSKKPKKAEKNVKLPTKASVISLATEMAELPAKADAAERLGAVDDAVLQRIKKALALGSHEGTGEAEAKAAMRQAAKLMTMHNVDQADILAAEDDSTKLKRAGQSSLDVLSADNSGKRVIFHAWTNILANAMMTFFDCKCYSTTTNSVIKWTFYGLAEQTAAAALGFEMTYNLILTWSLQKTNIKGRSAKNTYCHGVARGLYDLACDQRKQEEKLAIEGEKKRIALAIEEEEASRARGLLRLKELEEPMVTLEVKVERETMDRKVKLEVVEDEDWMPIKKENSADERGSTKFEANDEMRYPEDDDDERSVDSRGARRCSCRGDGWGRGNDSDDSDGDDERNVDEDEDEGRADFDDRDADDPIKMETKPPVSVKTETPVLSQMQTEPIVKEEPFIKKEETDDDASPWKSAQQLTLFRNNAESIADDYLKNTIKTKLKSSRKAKGPNVESKENWKAYKEGKEDARKVDVKRRRLKGTEDDS